ncbi:heparinase II/III family protein [Candidatus Endoriftia persephone]|jgi:hypothetical protein|uniref:Heparinase II/III family protein n=3 Tax=Gammaproteobacteria TaxID=1236 RepID=G2FDV2_9GAMM|nr:alginate lyase family protein [Candidatus Endoriftia persephone]EGV51203.1 heparinase II/III family protein [endosymbiont of Riftia pachyptila (vent Ph05)]EGW54936.1 heparinase II/III family protein [endosymbiont of Tevnia jerichonana (vent Tica)]USF87908.1 heparinase II/III family protein [Candidatus Endoriftia persephone]
MSSLAWKINRIKAMSPAELLFRVGRVVQGKVEKQRLSAGWRPKPKGSVGSRGGLFQGESEQIVSQWRAAYAGQLAGYEPLLDGDVDIFGHLKVNLLDGFNWHRDPESGIVAPLLYGKGIDYRDNHQVGNCKTLWEVARHPHLVPLAVAYAVTGDERYVRLVTSQIDSWIAQNPFGLGVHWCSTLEVALRLVAWALVHSLFCLRDEQGLFSRVSDSEALGNAIYQHAHFIRHYLSRHSSANNHLIGELTGLWLGCRVFDLGAEGEVWAALAKRELEAEAVKQVFEDGVNKEQANYYHLWVMEYLYLNWLVGERYAEPFSDTFRERIIGMQRFISALRPPGGVVPQIGDSDDGVVARFEPADSPDPYREVCSAIQAVLEDGCEAQYLSQKVFWYSLIAGRSAQIDAGPEADDQPAGQLFPKGGYAVLRGGGAHLIFDAGPLGYPSIAAHGHADALSFCMALDGQWWLVDPGTYCYHTQPDWRDYFRSTAAHNALEVNGHDQSLIGGAFLWLQRSKQQIGELQQSADGEQQSISGSVSGYADPQIRHHREITLDARQRKLRVTDRIEGGAAALRLLFQFHPNVRLYPGELKHHFYAEIEGEPHRLEICADEALQWEVRHGEENPHLGWYSERLGQKVPIDVLVGTLQAASGCTINCEFSW